jgi:hypothetical protein
MAYLHSGMNSLATYITYISHIFNLLAHEMTLYKFNKNIEGWQVGINVDTGQISIQVHVCFLNNVNLIVKIKFKFIAEREHY